MERVQKRSNKIHRKDDHVEIAKKRYKEYLNNVYPLLLILKKKNKLIEINGNDDIGTVYVKTQEAMEKIMESFDIVELFERHWSQN